MNKIGILIIGIAVLAGGAFLISQRGVPSLQDQSVAEEDMQVEDGIVFEQYTEDVFEQYKGKPIIANSWATWCPFCINELPDFAAIKKEVKSDLVVLAINRKESFQQAKKFTDKLGVTEDFVYLLDPDDLFYKKKLGGLAMPETLFIDREGNIVFHKRGVMPIEEIRQRVQEII
jgi:thiol-disulfide isomerase/thioredoxin